MKRILWVLLAVVAMLALIAASATSPRPKAYIGLSSETKPTGDTTTTGSTYYEYDTGRTYIYADSTSTWYNTDVNIYTTAADTVTAAGVKPGVASKGFPNLTVVAGAEGGTISISFIAQGYISGMRSWQNLSTGNTTVAADIADSTQIVTYTNIAYCDSVRIKTTAVSTADSLIYKLVLWKER